MTIATWYVATTGLDTNPGTALLPFRTIPKASTVVGPGDTVWVAPGSYTGGFLTPNTSNGTAGNPITYISTVKWGAKLTAPASGIEYAWDNRGQYNVIDGFEVDGTTDANNIWTVGIGGAGTGSIVQNCLVHHVFYNGTASSHGGAGVLMDSWYGASNMHAWNNVCHHNGPPTGGALWYHGVYHTGTGSIKGNLCYKNAGGGIQGWHDDNHVDILNNTVFSNGYGIITGGGDFVIGSGPCDYMNVRNNIVVYNAVGFDEEGYCGTHNIYDHNLVYGNGVAADHHFSTGAAVLLNSIVADPMFVNWQADGSGNYHLAAGSPAARAGSDGLSVGAFQSVPGHGGTAVNDRDAQLQATVPRYATATNVALLLAASSPVFQVSSGGSGLPATITFTATPLNAPGAIGFTTSDGTVLTVGGRTATLAFANMGGNTVTVTATVTVDGVVHTATQTVTKVYDGASGATGLQNALVYAYQRAASAPTLLPGAVTFTFAAGGITTPAGNALANGWTKGIPAGSDPLYVTISSASSNTATDTIANNEWNTPVILAQDGGIGPSSTTVYIYQRAASNVAPTLPSATTTYTFVGGGLTGLNNGWSASVPGSGGGYLFVSTATASSTATTDTIGAGEWAAAQLLSQDGSVGAAGRQAATAIVYQWAATIPSGPLGAATYTWATGLYGAAPSGWALTPGTSPSQGFTLWAAKVAMTDVATNTTTAFNWNTASLVASGYAGVDGATGGTGLTGSSYRLAYTDVTGNSLATTPATATTTGSTSFPATGTWGETVAWTATVPTIAAGHALFQIDGVYSPTTGNTVWGVPYLSSLKVGSLSAITANLGNITSGDVYGTVLHGGAGYASSAYSWPSTGASGNGFHLSASGLLIGNPSAAGGGYFQVNSNGDIYSRQFSIVAGVATFAGALSAASGTFNGAIMGGSYTGWGWPTSGSGFYLGPNGLLLGNANTGGYCEITSAGDILTPAFSVVGGTMTLDALSVVKTINVGDNQITVSPTTFIATQTWGDDTWQQVISVQVTNTSAVPIKILLMFSARQAFPNGNNYSHFQMYKDGGPTTTNSDPTTGTGLIYDYGRTGGASDFPNFAAPDVLAANSTSNYYIYCIAGGSGYNVGLFNKSLMALGVKK